MCCACVGVGAHSAPVARTRRAQNTMLTVEAPESPTNNRKLQASLSTAEINCAATLLDSSLKGRALTDSQKATVRTNAMTLYRRMRNSAYGPCPALLLAAASCDCAVRRQGHWESTNKARVSNKSMSVGCKSWEQRCPTAYHVGTSNA